ncbi:hypothetical protein PGT21_025018 [Puccinia graminis f. sp. tritici]|uniref:Uncharacterized protein n=1 Tax=Puccinia graminis f. sp. tritici TaxID=56615 RepID=A0A5B0M2N7_PUCGR|nr:hypothetical protein PGT21_025018 [Puccinia graminis f. sp. tritici]KAA1132572.1 hypothetical protein PGTUg99_007649 [Puccinia graminis f. sp. tritici]
MRHFSFSAYLLALLAQIVLALPPPTEHRTVADRELSPQYATLSSPLSGQRFFRGQAFPISFTDPGTSATEARFSLSNYTGVYFISKASLKSKGRISYKVTLPAWVADGTYDFVVSENDGPFGSDDFNTDVVICTIFVGHARANQMEFAPFRNQVEENQKKIHSSDPQTTHSSPALQKRAPHPPKFVTPLSNQSVKAGSPISIRFLDGQLDPGVTQARFVLRPLVKPIGPQELVLAGPNATQEGLYKFDGVAIVTNVTFPEGTPPGVYSLEAEEEYPQSPNRFQSAATIQIQIVAEDAIVTQQEPLDIDKEMEEEIQLATNRASLKIRSEISSPPQKSTNPAFISPTENQKITTGHHLNISFINAGRKSDKMRFILRPISANPKQKELLLFSRNAESEQLFTNETTCNTRLFFPLAIANGTYKLVAQEVYSAEKVKDVGSVQIRVAQLRPTNTLKSRDLLTKDAGQLSSWGGVPKPLEKKVHPLLPVTAPEDLPQSQPVAPKKFQVRQTRDSPSMLEPVPNQEVPSGSTFLCKIQDKHATSETVRFVLRSFGGYEQYLGSTKFVNGIATLKATCPSNLRYDTYNIVALVNSIKKPQRFLDVISASVIVSHGQTLMMASQAPLLPPKKSSSTAQLIVPVYNQFISGGKVFQCQLSNGINAERVKFCLRFDDGRSDLQVGNCEMKKNVAQTMCQIPSSVTPGTYTFVAQKSSTSKPDFFEDVDQVTITLANPRGFGPDLENQQANEVVKRSIETAESRQAAQVSVLLEPMSYQSIVPGQVFNVKMTKNTAPLSTMLKFLLKPMSTAFVHKEYVLGTSSNDQTVDETLRCPDHITLGNYLFVVQANDPNDPEKYIDSNSTPIVVNSKSTTSPSIK